MRFAQLAFWISPGRRDRASDEVLLHNSRRKPRWVSGTIVQEPLSTHGVTPTPHSYELAVHRQPLAADLHLFNAGSFPPSLQGFR